MLDPRIMYDVEKLQRNKGRDWGYGIVPNSIDATKIPLIDYVDYNEWALYTVADDANERGSYYSIAGNNVVLSEWIDKNCDENYKKKFLVQGITKEEEEKLKNREISVYGLSHAGRRLLKEDYEYNPKPSRYHEYALYEKTKDGKDIKFELQDMQNAAGILELSKLDYANICHKHGDNPLIVQECEKKRGTLKYSVLNYADDFCTSFLLDIVRYFNFTINLEDKYKDFDFIIADRYTTSNAIYQAAKINPQYRLNYWDWLFNCEYQKFKNPVPDLVIFLEMPFKISQKLILKRYGGDESKKDLYEKDAKYLRLCQKISHSLAIKYKWKIVPCFDVKNNNLLTPAEISFNVFDTVKDYFGI